MVIIMQIVKRIKKNIQNIQNDTLQQASPNYGRRAGCGPQELFIWPAETFVYGIMKDNFLVSCLKVDSHILRYDAARHEAVRQDAAETHGCCSHMQRSVSRCKRGNTASSHLVTSQVFTLRNIAEDGKCYLFALDKKSFGNPEAN